MKMLLPSKPYSHHYRNAVPCRHHVLCLIFTGLLVAATRVEALNHPPLVSWIPDQRIQSGGFTPQYFRIINFDAPGVTFSTMVQSTNTSFYSASSVMASACTGLDLGCAQDGTGWKVTFIGNPTSDGVTTIIIRANENGMGGKVGSTSFTLRRDSIGGNNPPTIQNLPNRAVQVDSNSGNVASYVTNFVIGDLTESGMEDIDGINLADGDLTATSTLTNLFQELKIELNPPDEDVEIATLEGPRSYKLTAKTVANPSPTVAPVRVDVTDPDGNVTSTSFLIRVVAASNAAPSISNPSGKNFEEQISQSGSTTHSYTVLSNDTTMKQDLKVTGFSSNTNLVPNDLTNNIKVTQPDSNGAGSVEIVPVLPLPSPSPGVPQAATITLSVADDAYIRQTTFLYVLRDPASPAVSFSRPSGVYPTTLPSNLNQDVFLTGSSHNLQWDKVEGTEGTYDWANTIDLIIDDLLPLPDKDLSLGLQKEPCYIAQDLQGQLEFDTWCDTKMGNQPRNCTPPMCTDGFQRAVPWDSRLRVRRRAFLQALASHLNENSGLRMSKISIVNPNLPGADDGIRKVSAEFDPDCINNPRCMPGYTRERLLWAIQDELRTVQDNFPGKLVQIGFFPDDDGQDSAYGDATLWQWLYKDATTDPDALDENGVHLVALFDEFNGVKRPRVSFFQENLAATRTTDTVAVPAVARSSAPNYSTPANTKAYTITPIESFIPSFAYYDEALTAETYNNGITFEANTIWSNPFTDEQGRKLTLAINGSPNDALEGAFNAYLSQYLEVYVRDIDEAIPLAGGAPLLNAELWKGQLLSWHDYAAHLRSDVTPLEAPAGLTVERENATSNLVKWHAVYGAARYQLQRRDLATESAEWVEVFGCQTTTETQCTDTSSTGSTYGYRVQAQNTGGSIQTPWAYVAVFLSEGTLLANYDGYVQFNGSTKTPINNASEPGIRAGTGTGSIVSKGFLSFDTSALAGTTVLAARLRMYETTGTAFDSSHPCHIDVKTGAFNDNLMLEGNDYDAPATDLDVAQMQPLNSSPSTPLNWFQAEIHPKYLGDINQFGRTQFRLYFTGLATSKMARWNAGDTYPSGVDKPPQLIVQYLP